MLGPDEEPTRLRLVAGSECGYLEKLFLNGENGFERTACQTYHSLREMTEPSVCET